MKFLLTVLLIVAGAAAQEVTSDRISNLRVQGALDARFPVTLVASRPLTISFDGTETDPQRFVVRLWHCDRNWQRTESIFLNDPSRNAIRTQIPFTRAPIGVERYHYSYALRLPGANDWERFTYSGNYTLEIWDADEAQRLGTARFIVAESLLAGGVRVWNRQDPSAVSPLNQVHKILVAYRVPPQDPGNPAPVYAQFIRTMDVYRNRECSRPYRVDLDDQDPDTFIEGWGTDDLQFSIDNLPCGNEYRMLDVRNTDLYPPGVVLHRRDGADVIRWLHQGPRDHDGASTQVNAGQFADDVEYQFELLVPPEHRPDSVFVVGDFNGWTPGEPWRMRWDDASQRFVVRGQFRRGQYDYQYVADGTDWTALEGNDWRTTDVYTAVLYYHDPRFGGFDRVLAVAQGRSPGGTEATTR